MTNQDPQRRTQLDHDLLIVLNTKFDALIIDVKQWNDNLSQKVTDVEARVRNIETIRDQYIPTASDNLKRLNEVYEWKKEFQSTYRTIIGVAGAVGTAVGVVMTIGANLFLGFFNHVKK